MTCGGAEMEEIVVMSNDVIVGLAGNIHCPMCNEGSEVKFVHNDSRKFRSNMTKFS
jgi:hypothetical protein